MGGGAVLAVGAQVDLLGLGVELWVQTTGQRAASQEGAAAGLEAGMMEMAAARVAKVVAPKATAMVATRGARVVVPAVTATEMEEVGTVVTWAVLLVEGETVGMGA